ncbi:hypothetical protein Amsp01_006300 [Amycolatopsis sp. NBRC 101858]|nr:hypothetical protein Amsp01_006300 [Amycolatopsis sp. NBRC 101858]
MRNPPAEQDDIPRPERNRLELRTPNQRSQPGGTGQHNVKGGTGGVIEPQPPRRTGLGVSGNGRTGTQGGKNIRKYIHRPTLARRWDNTTRV